MGVLVSIDEYLRQKLYREAFDGPLTECESSSTESDPPSERCPPQASGIPELPSAATPGKGHAPKVQKGKQRWTMRRRAKRSAEHAAAGWEEKQVVKKRCTEAAKEALQLSFSILSDVHPTKPGWVGKRVASLPRQAYTLAELVSDYGMTVFPWEGRCAASLCFLPDCLMGTAQTDAPSPGQEEPRYRRPCWPSA